jgi:hypothetical protein
MGEVGDHDQLGWAGTPGDQIARHLHGKEAVFFSVDDEDRDSALAEGLLG